MHELEADAILFDSDGVLIDSHRVVETAWRQLSAEFELDADRLIHEQPGVRAEETLSRYLTGERALQAVERLEDLEFELAGQVEAMPGARRLTGQMHSFPYAIVTSGSRRLATARWRTAGIDVPRVVVTADDITSGKPDPAPYMKAAQLLNVDPAKCVVFEDSPSGGASAFALGGKVVAVGDQAWPIEPSIRIGDLEQVSFRHPQHPGHSGLLTIHIR
jgi:sugar-phosphatase